MTPEIDPSTWRDEPPRHQPMRYTDFVKAMRVVLPVSAVAVVLLLLVWPQFRKLNAPPPVAAPAQPQMTNTRYYGVDKENRPYSVTADRVQQQDGTPGSAQGSLHMDNPMADMTLSDGSWLAAKAANGLYDQKAQNMNLDGGVTLYRDDGHQLSADQVQIDLHNNQAVGTGDVQGHGPKGEMTARGFTIDQKTGDLTLIGPVRLMLREGPTSAPEGATP